MNLFSFFTQILALFGYLDGTEDFEKPLDKAAEKEALTQAKAGDRKAREKLIEHNMRLVAYIVQKYKNCNIDTKDLISIGTIGLIKGIDTYNEKKATKLSTYVIRCIENEILMVIRTSKKKQNDVSLDEPLGVENDGRQLTLSDIIKDDNADVFQKIEDKINRERMHELLKRLNPLEYKILDMRYGLTNGVDMTQKDVAKELGISRSYVSRIETKAINRIKNML